MERKLFNHKGRLVALIIWNADLVVVDAGVPVLRELTRRRSW